MGDKGLEHYNRPNGPNNQIKDAAQNKSRTYNSSIAHETFSRKEHMPRHKTILAKFQKTVIILCPSQLQQNEIKNHNYKENLKLATMEIKQHSLNNQWVKEEIRKKKKKITEYLERNNYEIQHTKMYGMQQKHGNFRVVNTHIKKEKRLQINNLILDLK